MRTLVLALGNPILSDNAVGWEVADRLPGLLPRDTDIVKECGATLDLLPKLAGFARLAIVDAIQLGQAPLGTVYRFDLAHFASTVRYSSAHDINFASAFALGREWGYHIPRDIRIYGIEVKELRRFSETCTPELRAELERIAATIAADLRNPSVAAATSRPVALQPLP